MAHRCDSTFYDSLNSHVSQRYGSHLPCIIRVNAHEQFSPSRRRN